jgi:hypothetical protein
MNDPHTWNDLARQCADLQAENAELRKKLSVPPRPARPLIYIASPYSGLHENYARAQRDMMILTETYRQYDFISPIVSYGFCYDIYSYDDGIRQCLGLLAHCNQLWILHDDGVSRGVKIEREFAIKHNIPIKECAENF